MAMMFPWRTQPIEDPERISFLTVSQGDVVGQIVGMTDGGVTYLTDLYVEVGYRGRGLGSNLMRLFLERAKGTTIIVVTQDAAEFYRKFGFVERTAMTRRPDAAS